MNGSRSRNPFKKHRDDRRAGNAAWCLSGQLVGFSLGLIAGRGSILAVVLMVHLVGVSNPHVAIGTSALAVATNAAMGLFNHTRRDGEMALRIIYVPLPTTGRSKTVGVLLQEK